MNRSWLPMGAFIGCATIWSSTFLAIRVGNDDFPAVWACALRLIVAALALNLMLLASRQRWPTGDALKAAAWYGILEFGISLPLLYWGEKEVNSGLAAVIYGINPIATMVGARALGMEKLNPVRLGAAAFGLAGVCVVFWRQTVGGASLIGMLAIATAVCSGSMAPTLLQRGPRQGAIGANAVGAVVALPLAFGISFLLGEAHPFPRTANQVVPILYLAIASSVVAFGLLAWLMNHWKISTVSFLGVIVPVLAVVLGAVFRHETFAPGAAVGAIMVLASVAVALRAEAGSQQSKSSLQIS